MEGSLTVVTLALKKLVTAPTTSKNRLPIRAPCRNCFLPTWAQMWWGKCLTRRAWTTLKKLVTTPTTSKNRLPIRAPCRNYFLPTWAQMWWGKCLTRRAWTWVALQNTNMQNPNPKYVGVCCRNEALF